MKIIRIVLVLLLVAVVAGFIAYKFINKSAPDLSDSTPEKVFTWTELIDQSSDTASLYQFKDKLIAVSGNVKKIAKDLNKITLELGDSNNVSSIICQVDDRHVADFANVKENSTAAIKGLLRSAEVDDSGLGLGNTVQLNYCVKSK